MWNWWTIMVMLSAVAGGSEGSGAKVATESVDGGGQKILTYTGGFKGLLKGNIFSFKTELPMPREKPKFVFVLAMHGMTPPVQRQDSFPENDQKSKYGGEWQFNQATSRGNQLMNMVGRSLRHRYHAFLQSLTADKILVTSRDSQEYSISNGAQVLHGLLKTTKHEENDMQVLAQKVRANNQQVDYDGFDLTQCTWRKKIVDDLLRELAIPGNALVLKYCTRKFYQAIMISVIKLDSEDAKKSYWNIDEPSKLYKLWKILWFQVQEGKSLYEVFTQNWANIVACVFDYQRFQMAWHPDVPAATIGRMFNQIQKDKEDSAVGFHLHITDDVTLGWFLWSLPNNDRNVWPDYGDSLMVEVFDDDKVEVYLYSAITEEINRVEIGDVTFDNLKAHFGQRGLNLTPDERNRVCAFTPPQATQTTKT